MCSAAHRVDRTCKGPPEAEGSAAIVAERPAGHHSRVGGEAVVVAHVAPEAALKDLKAAVLVTGAGAAVNEAGRAVKICTIEDSLLSMSG